MTDDDRRAQETSEQSAETGRRTPTEPLDDERRRALMVAVAGALVTAGVLTPEKAKAQFFGGGGVEIPGLSELIDLLLSAFDLAPTISIPGATIGVINDLLDLLGAAGSDTTLRSANVEGALAARFPTDPALTRDAQTDASMRQVEAMRRVVVQSQLISSTLAETQGQMTNAEEALIRGAQSPGDSEGATKILQGILAMQGSIAARMGMLATAISAQNQMIGDHLMMQVNAKEQGMLYTQQFMGTDGDDIPPPRFGPGG